MKTRLQQVTLVLAGAAVALVMIFLGLWQAQVFVEGGNRSIEDRAAQPPVALADNINPDGTLGDIFGKHVIVTGRYLPDLQLMIPADDGTMRVLTALRLSDGRVLPVVRGLATSQAAIAPPPLGDVTQTGLFLPGEGDSTRRTVEGEIGSVRMPLLAQVWQDYRLFPGFITLSETDSLAQGFEAAPVELPEGEGPGRNAGYALQWWVFAIFGMWMIFKVAGSMGKHENESGEAAPMKFQSRRKGESVDIETAKELIEPEDLPGIKSALKRYRIMAYVVGVLLVVLVVVGMPMKYIWGNDAVVVATGVPHGWLYMVLLITAYDLGRRVRWPWVRLILIAAGGTVPFMSFVAEHYATRDVQKRIEAVEAEHASA